MNALFAGPPAKRSAGLKPLGNMASFTGAEQNLKSVRRKHINSLSRSTGVTPVMNERDSLMHYYIANEDGNLFRGELVGSTAVEF
jgi:hypothetical protein